MVNFVKSSWSLNLNTNQDFLFGIQVFQLVNPGANSTIGIGTGRINADAHCKIDLLGVQG
jgi:hypothetical protein